MASVRERNGKRGKTFMALYRDDSGRQKSAGSYGTRKEALKAGRLAEAGVMPVKAETAYASKIRGKATVAAYAREWFSIHPMSPHTRYVYDAVLRVHILPALGGRVMAEVTTADIRAYFRRLEARQTSASLGKKIKTVLSSMFQTAAEDGVIPVNVVRGVRFQASPPKRRRALTADEWHRVRRYLTGDDRLLFEIVMGTGARIEEVLGMETGDISDGVWTISRVRNEINSVFSNRDKTKTGRARQVRIGPELVRQITERGPGRVFPDVTMRTRRTHWKYACACAGLDWSPAPRDLRRSFATLARAGGADLEAVRIALGHTRLMTTDLYLGERPEARDDALLAVQRALGAA
jgi:integrase